ncbi:MAG: hypothetical protein NTZ97_01230 [Candidatus Moranbacteria bacterium]|nr:hypothetical protein [Candidatus Moranbacteria bacterium]
MPENVYIQTDEDFLVALSSKNINSIRGCLILSEYDKTYSEDSKNLEILKFMASQSLFLYCYMAKCEKETK